MMTPRKSRAGDLVPTPRSGHESYSSLMITPRTDFDEESGEWDENDPLVEKIEGGTKSDVYWLFALRVLHLADNQEFKAHKVEYIMGMTHSILVYVITLTLQLTITAFLMLAAARIEAQYHDGFEVKVGVKLDEATARMNAAVASSARMDMNKINTPLLGECIEQLRVRYEWIYPVMIFIWACNMLIELKDVSKDLSTFLGMPRWVKGTRQFSEDGKTVVSLSHGTRLILLVVIPGIRGFVALVLLFAGCKVLLFKPTMMLVVMSSMSLLFVVNLDDLMMNALSGAKTKKELGDLKFVYHKKHTWINRYWTGGMSGTVHALGCIAFSLTYVYLVNTSLMNFRQSCWSYYYAFPGAMEPAFNIETFGQMFSNMFDMMLKGLLFQ